ncbi:MAG: 4Fe-4S binding protein [Chloroflexota bacterium]
MLQIPRAALRTGLVTTAYPNEPDMPPPAFRGRPEIDPSRCDLSGACVSACPSGVISIEDVGSGARRWQLDLAGCVFCGLCSETCPTGAMSMGKSFELATRTREDLLTIVDHLPDGAATPTASRRAAQPSGQTAASRFSAAIHRVLRRSLHIRHMDAGSDNSTDWEISALLSPVYDIQRLGLDVVASPRHADVLLVTGAITRNLEVALLDTYNAMPEPRIVVAAGAEACGGGVLRGAYAVAGGADRVVPVDVYVPGDPPRPHALIFGLLLAVERIEQKQHLTHRHKRLSTAPS